MNVNTEDFSKIIIAWLDNDFIPKIDLLNIPTIQKTLMKAGITAFLVYNKASFDNYVNKAISVFTLNDSTINLERLKEALDSFVDANNGVIKLKDLFPNLTILPNYDIDKDDVKSFIEIAKGFAK